MHFTLEMLPARDGDALVLEWGQTGPQHRMLIDGGRGGATLSDALSDWFARHPQDWHFDLIVCTHMDADHISGLIGLFNDAPPGFSVDQIWFNAFRHLPDTDILGWRQSDTLEALIEGHAKDHKTKWNATCTTGPAVAVPDDPADGLPDTTIHGLKITLLSPTVDQLAKVAREWPAEVRAARLETPQDDDDPEDPHNDVLGHDEDIGVPPDELARRPYTPDRSRANGASIAFAAEFAGKRVLLCADAHAETLEDTLRRWQPQGAICCDAVKLSHHGGAKNLSPDLLAMLDCPTWLISTNGSRHHHPDRRAIARLITRRTETHLICNYHSDETEEWGRASLQMKYGFSAHLPPKDQPGAVFDIISGSAV